MKETFDQIKALVTGEWKGGGFANFPTIEPTAYTEHVAFEADTDKDLIRFEQKAWYKNETAANGKTVFWDTGFILLKEDKIWLISAQSGGRAEIYMLTAFAVGECTFDSHDISNDEKTIRSQRILRLSASGIAYELNMSTRQAAEFQNHLAATLQRS